MAIDASADDARIEGLEIVAPEEFADERGSLAEVYRRSWLSDGGDAVQANLSTSRAGVLRGLHWHRRQRDYWCFLEGRAFAAFVDLRERSTTQRAVLTLQVDAGRERVGISVPPGVAHGFQ